MVSCHYTLSLGKEVWRTTRHDLEWGRYDLLAVDDRLLLMQGSSPGGGIFSALNINSGEVAWKRDIKPTTRSIYHAALKQLCILERSDTNNELITLDAETGIIRWRTNLADIDPEQNINLVLHDKSLFILSHKVYKVTALTGEVVWQQSVPGFFDDAENLKLRATKHGVLLWDSKRIALLDSDSGSQLWGEVYPSEPLCNKYFEEIQIISVPVESDVVFVATKKKKVYSFNLSDGPKNGDINWTLKTAPVYRALYSTLPIKSILQLTTV